MATLVILAGGYGTRFGGIKQFRPVGPNGECLLHYSIYDGLQAGFENFVLLTRKELDSQIQENVFPILKDKVKVDLAYQETPDGKAKGTAHALLACEGVTKGSIGLINADDFYGADSYKTLFELVTQHPGPKEAVVVPYLVSTTISDRGLVSRAVVEATNGKLDRIEEHHKVGRIEGVIQGQSSKGTVSLDDDTMVSMNMFGFSSDIYDDLRSFCEREERENPGKEMLLPTWLNENIANGTWNAYCKETDAEWFGMTYVEELPEVEQRLSTLMATSVYPERLW